MIDTKKAIPEPSSAHDKDAISEMTIENK